MTPRLPLLLRGARVVDPATRTDEVLDLWVESAGVRREVPPGRDPATVEDLAGKVVAPAFVEIHAHLREPGGEESETIASGTDAARAGGYGTVLAMANTRPPNDRPEVTRRILGAAEAAGHGVRVHPVTAATRGLEGREPAPWRDQVGAGCVAISDDGRPVADPAVLEAVLRAAADLSVPYLSHAECPELFHGPVHAGAAARALGVEGIPTACESRAVAAEAALAARVGAAIHFCHLSTAESLATLGAARSGGARVSAEATPHHLLLDETELLRRGPDPDLKMNPPLRSPEDREALVEALRTGLVAAVATDHAPHAPRLKARGLEGAPFGVIGMENAFAVLHDALVARAGWPLGLLLERLTLGPARIARLPAGRLFDGPPALVVLDPASEWTIDPARFRSRSRNCPFAGRTVRGRVVATLLAGGLRAEAE